MYHADILIITISLECLDQVFFLYSPLPLVLLKLKTNDPLHPSLKKKKKKVQMDLGFLQSKCIWLDLQRSQHVALLCCNQL